MSYRALTISNTVRYIWNHPLGGRSGLVRFARWQVGARVLRSSAATFKWVDDTQLELELGMQGATGNLYCGLHEYADMSLLLDLLRPGQLFVDVGANVGSYTVLASGACGAETLALEPGTHAFERLQRQITLNRIDDLVDARNVGAATEPGTLRFSSGQDTVNHVLSGPRLDSNAVLINVDTLDNLLAGRCPTLVKIDVEGWEPAVLAGAERMLDCTELLVCIVEANELVSSYGFAADAIETTMVMKGFCAYTYLPEQRRLVPGSDPMSNNVIFVRDIAKVRDVVSRAPKRRIFGQ